MTVHDSTAYATMTIAEFCTALHALLYPADYSEIERGIPIPTLVSNKGGQIYPWDQLEIGDSFRMKYSRTPVSAANVRYAPKKFVGKTLSQNGVKFVRIWKIA